jgi:nicotinamidase/pyrazinamidase
MTDKSDRNPQFPQVFLDVDTQLDFLDPEGNLYVDGAESIHQVLRDLASHAASSGIKIVSTADDHPPDDPEFDDYPPHCVQGTPGQAKLDGMVLGDCWMIPYNRELAAEPVALLDQHDQLLFTKVTFNPFSNPYFAALVDSAPVGEYVVFGVATDVCVKAAVESLLEHECRVALVTDAVKAIDAARGEEICQGFSDRGVRLLTCNEVTRSAV